YSHFGGSSGRCCGTAARLSKTRRPAASSRFATVGVIRAAWSSVSFLFYAGALTVLVSALWLLSILSDDYGDAAFVGWAALVLGFAYTCAFSFRRAGRPVLAGLFAFVS